MKILKLKNVVLIFTVLLSFLFIGALPYDDKAELDYSLNNTNMFGYRIIMIKDSPYVNFRDKDKPLDNLARYNWKMQFWLMKTGGFNSK